MLVYIFFSLISFHFDLINYVVLWPRRIVHSFFFLNCSFLKAIEGSVFTCSDVSDSLQLCEQQPTSLLCPWGFSRQEYWSGLPCPPPGDLPNPGIEPRSPTLQADSLPAELRGRLVEGLRTF